MRALRVKSHDVDTYELALSSAECSRPPGLVERVGRQGDLKVRPVVMCFFFFPLPSEICVECESRGNYFSPNRRTAVLLDHSVSLVQDLWMSEISRLRRCTSLPLPVLMLLSLTADRKRRDCTLNKCLEKAFIFKTLIRKIYQLIIASNLCIV